MTPYSASTLERIASELEAADKEMTPGPWRRSNGGLGVLSDAFSASDWVCKVQRVTPVNDAAGIAHLRNSAPEVAAALRSAVAEVERLRKLAIEACHIAQDWVGSDGPIPDGVDYRADKVRVAEILIAAKEQSK